MPPISTEGLVEFLGTCSVIAFGGIEIYIRQPASFQKHYGPKVVAILASARGELGDAIDKICRNRQTFIATHIDPRDAVPVGDRKGMPPGTFLPEAIDDGSG